MKINLEELRKRSKYIKEQKHPEEELIIWNYTQNCQFDKAWDEYTMMCRGLITDLEGNIVARPFKKFFNYGEYKGEIPNETPSAYEKLDGSLGIQYFHNGKWRIATRGSFTSDQAIWATKWFQNRFGEDGNKIYKDMFDKSKTYLWEIIYPENRIVVNYRKRSELVLLAIVDTETGNELENLATESYVFGVSRAKYYYVNNIDEFVEASKKLCGDEEGFVLHWPSNNLRIKIKGEEYVRLHRVLTQVSSKNIWEMLMKNQPMEEIIERVPDEFFHWVINVKGRLVEEFKIIETKVLSALLKIQELEDRKSMAIEIQNNFKELSTPLFAALDKKDYSKHIWNMVKPKFEKPFKVDIDS